MSFVQCLGRLVCHNTTTTFPSEHCPFYCSPVFQQVFPWFVSLLDSQFLYSSVHESDLRLGLRGRRKIGVGGYFCYESIQLLNLFFKSYLCIVFMSCFWYNSIKLGEKGLT